MFLFQVFATPKSAKEELPQELAAAKQALLSREASVKQPQRTEAIKSISEYAKSNPQYAKQAAGILIEFLNNSQLKAKYQIAPNVLHALGDIGVSDANVVAACIKSLSSDDNVERFQAVHALRRLEYVNGQLPIEAFGALVDRLKGDEETDHRVLRSILYTLLSDSQRTLKDTKKLDYTGSDNEPLGQYLSENGMKFLEQTGTKTAFVLADLLGEVTASDTKRLPAAMGERRRYLAAIQFLTGKMETSERMALADKLGEVYDKFSSQTREQQMHDPGFNSILNDFISNLEASFQTETGSRYVSSLQSVSTLAAPKLQLYPFRRIDLNNPTPPYKNPITSGNAVVYESVRTVTIDGSPQSAVKLVNDFAYGIYKQLFESTNATDLGSDANGLIRQGSIDRRELVPGATEQQFRDYLKAGDFINAFALLKSDGELKPEFKSFLQNAFKVENVVVIGGVTLGFMTKSAREAITNAINNMPATDSFFIFKGVTVGPDLRMLETTRVQFDENETPTLVRSKESFQSYSAGTSVLINSSALLKSVPLLELGATAYDLIAKDVASPTYRLSLSAPVNKTPIVKFEGASLYLNKENQPRVETDISIKPVDKIGKQNIGVAFRLNSNFFGGEVKNKLFVHVVPSEFFRENYSWLADAYYKVAENQTSFSPKHTEYGALLSVNMGNTTSMYFNYGLQSLGAYSTKIGRVGLLVTF